MDFSVNSSIVPEQWTTSTGISVGNSSRKRCVCRGGNRDGPAINSSTLPLSILAISGPQSLALTLKFNRKKNIQLFVPIIFHNFVIRLRYWACLNLAAANPLFVAWIVITERVRRELSATTVIMLPADLETWKKLLHDNFKSFLLS